jgi:hypothetical protein
MHTVVETAEFQKQAKAVWSDAEREAFIEWIAANPDAGDVIPGADGHARCAGAVREKASAAG